MKCSLKVKTTGEPVEDDSESMDCSYEAEDDSQSTWESNDALKKQKQKKDLYPIIRSVVLKKKYDSIQSLAKEFPHLSSSELEG